MEGKQSLLVELSNSRTTLGNCDYDSILASFYSYAIKVVIDLRKECAHAKQRVDRANTQAHQRSHSSNYQSFAQSVLIDHQQDYINCQRRLADAESVQLQLEWKMDQRRDTPETKESPNVYKKSLRRKKHPSTSKSKESPQKVTPPGSTRSRRKTAFRGSFLEPEDDELTDPEDLIANYCSVARTHTEQANIVSEENHTKMAIEGTKRRRHKSLIPRNLKKRRSSVQISKKIMLTEEEAMKLQHEEEAMRRVKEIMAFELGIA